MINMLLYKVGQDPEVVEISGGIAEMKRFIGVDYSMDSASLPVEADEFTFEEYNQILLDDGWLPYGKISGKIKVWVDDEGILINKPYNRGFYGDFLVCKVDTEGFNVRMSEEEIKRVTEFFDKVGKTKKHPNERVEGFLIAMEKKLDPIPSNFHYEDPTFGTYVIGVSSKEVINDLRGCTDPETNEVLDDLAFGFFSGQLKIGKLEEIFEDLKKQYGQFQFNNRQKY